MKLTDDTRRGAHFIRGYSAGEIRIGERIVRTSCIVTAERIHEWRPASARSLTLEDLEPVLQLAPEIILLGTGETQHFPEAAVLGAVLARGVGCEVMTTGAACRTYNILIGEDRRVAAALLLER